MWPLEIRSRTQDKDISVVRNWWSLVSGDEMLWKVASPMRIACCGWCMAPGQMAWPSFAYCRMCDGFLSSILVYVVRFLFYCFALRCNSYFRLCLTSPGILVSLLRSYYTCFTTIWLSLSGPLEISSRKSRQGCTVIGNWWSQWGGMLCCMCDVFSYFILIYYLCFLMIAFFFYHVTPKAVG